MTREIERTAHANFPTRPRRGATELWAVCGAGALMLACSESASSGTAPTEQLEGSAANGGSNAKSLGSGGVSTRGGQSQKGTSTPSGGTSSSSARDSHLEPSNGGSQSPPSSRATTGGATAIGGAGMAGGATSTSGTAWTGGRSSTDSQPPTGGRSSNGGSLNAAGATQAGGTSTTTSSDITGPCDIYDAANTPCVAAHSTVRALYGKYTGKLYQVQRASDKQTKDIVALGPGGFADSTSQDTFCRNTTCTISIIYDQSKRANELKPAPGGGAVSTPDKPVTADKLKLTVGGHVVYGAYFEGGQGYRNNSKTTGLAKNDEPESMYMVASGKHYNDKCCWDYGNAETTNNDDGEGTMEAIYFGNCSFWGKGSGTGPWIMADIENGLWAGNVTPNTNNVPLNSDYITAMVKGKPHTLAIKGGNAQAGTLKTFWEGAYPAKGATGKPYDPMKKQGAIILGIGGDNSNGGTGTFFEGCITTGYATTTTDDAIQANIVAAGYGK